MAALDFPDSPSNGDEFSGYVYDSAKGVWNRLPTLPALDLVAFSATAPSSPQDGQFWFDTTSSKMYVYYNDGSSSQWVSALGGLAGQTGADGQFLIHDGTEWVASALASSNMPTGSVLQVVSTTKTDVFASSSGSFQDITGLSATITPKSATSKILVMVDVKLSSDSSAGYPQVKLLRDSTDIYVGDANGSKSRVGWGTYGTDASASALGKHGPNFSVNLTHLDSPATTSAVTYKIQGRGRATAAKFIYVNQGYNPSDTADVSVTASSITLMEVAG